MSGMASIVAKLRARCEDMGMISAEEKHMGTNSPRIRMHLEICQRCWEIILEALQALGSQHGHLKSFLYNTVGFLCS